MVASALLYAVVHWRAGSTEKDRNRFNKLVRRASSFLDCPLDPKEEMGERWMQAKLLLIMENISHPLDSLTLR